jgi:hypothetical protein
VEDALAESQRQLDDEGIFNIVTDGEAVAAMNTVNSLPPELQGKVIDKMDDGSFNNLLDEVPEERREEFDSMVDTVGSPERKIRLWAEQHKSQADNEEERRREDEGHWWNQSVAEKESERKNDRRSEIVGETKKEVNDEVKHLLGKEDLTIDQVNEVIGRKDLEHDIEMKYNVNLTNERGLRTSDREVGGVAKWKKGDKIVWSEDELREVESALARMPTEHVEGNKLLKNIHRDAVKVRDGEEKTNVGGDHSGGRIRVFDTGVVGNYRHTGQARELSDHHICPQCGARIARVEEVVIHEIGHDVHDQNKSTHDAHSDAAGWEKKLDEDALSGRGLTKEQIDDIKAGKRVVHDGQVFVKDPYKDGNFLAHNQDSIPEGDRDLSEADKKKSREWREWSYGRSNYKDHFAEHYMKAVLKPETLHEDLVEAPQAAVDRDQSDLEAAQQRIEDDERALAEAKKQGLDEPTTRALQENIDSSRRAAEKAEEALKQSKEDRDNLRTQYDLMREDIFGAPKMAADAEARLRSQGVEEARLEQFRDEAEKAHTRQQIEMLERKYSQP